MRVFYGFDFLPQFVHPAVTIGSYDGVHKGHKSLIDRLITEAHKQKGESIILTFDPHPRITLEREEGLRLLTSLEEKITLFEQMGVDNVVVIPFDQAFSSLSGGDFLTHYILGKIGAEILIVGYNHRFGHDRIDLRTQDHFGDLRIIRMDECHVAGKHVSSTTIRRLVDNGKIAEAELLLGHPLKIDTK